MLMLSLLLSLAFQDQIIGWNCDAQREVDGRVYRLLQTVEGNERSPRVLTLSWMSGPFRVERSVEWSGFSPEGGLPPAAPRVLQFWVPASARRSRPALRIRWPDGTERLLSNDPGAGWTISMSTPPAPPRLLFSSLSRDLNQALWLARSVHAVAEDRRGRVLGTLDFSFPDPAEPAGIAAALVPEVDAKLGDPANPANRCSSYGPEVYEDPVFPRPHLIGQPGSSRKSR